MKILTIAATPFFSDRGCHVRIYNQAKYLKKLGVEVKICTYFGGDDVEGFDIARIGNVSWYKKTAPGFSWGKFWLDIKLILLCRKMIREFKPDVIHAHLYEGLGVGFLAKTLAFRRTPIVIDLQGFLDQEFRHYSARNFVARKLFVWLSKRLIHRSDWLVLSSENLLPYMEKFMRNKQAITIVRDGIDFDIFENIPTLSPDEQRKIEDIKRWKNGNKMLVYIGGLSDNKGVGELLEGFRQLTHEGSQWKLLLGGFGQDENKYNEYIRRNNLENRIYSLGKVKYFSLPAYLALADASIDPKNGSSESSGKLMNLMAAGLPIICFDNEFNKARLGQYGRYIANISDLGKLLGQVGEKKEIKYDLDGHGEENEAKKLLGVMEEITAKN